MSECQQETFFDIYDMMSQVDSLSVDKIKEILANLKEKYDAGVKYETSTDYRTHYLNNSLTVYDEPVIVSNYRISDCYFEGIKIPLIFEASHVDFVTEKNDSRIVSRKKNMEELDFAAVVDFGKYWNPTEGLFQYGAGLMAYTYPDMSIADYDYSVVAYGAANDGWVNPFVKNIYHFTGQQDNCYELVVGLGNEWRKSESTLRAGYAISAYYRRYSNKNMGFTNADAEVYVGYGRFVVKARYVPFLDKDVVEKQMGTDWDGFDSDVEFFLSYQTTF